MSDVSYMLALAFCVCVVFSLLYQQALRPMLCDRARFRLFALRDKLRRSAIDGHISATSFEYQYLEWLLCRLIDKCSWFSWSSFFEFWHRNRDAELSPDARRFNSEANDVLKEIYNDAIAETIKVMLTNSPVWTVVLWSVLAVAKIFGWVSEQWLEIKTKIFLQEPLFEPELSPA